MTWAPGLLFSCQVASEAIVTDVYRRFFDFVHGVSSFLGQKCIKSQELLSKYVYSIFLTIYIRIYLGYCEAPCGLRRRPRPLRVCVCGRHRSRNRRRWHSRSQKLPLSHSTHGVIQNNDFIISCVTPVLFVSYFNLNFCSFLTWSRSFRM